MARFSRGVTACPAGHAVGTTGMVMVRDNGRRAAARRFRRRIVMGLLVVLAGLLGVALFRPLLLPGLPRLPGMQGTDQTDAADPNVARLLDAMGDADVDVAVRARDALTRRGAAVVPGLIDRLGHTEPRVRAAAALVLGSIADARAVRPLSEVLGDPDPLVRYRAVYALAQLKDPRAVPALAPLLLDPAPEVVHVAIRALEECRCKVRHRSSGPGYEILPAGQTEWQVVAPDSVAELTSGA